MSKATTITSLPSTSTGASTSKLSSLKSKTDLQKEVQEDEPLELSSDEEEALINNETYMEKFKKLSKFLKEFIDSILISATSGLNSVSRDYRFVAKRLSIEKKCLKRIIEIEENKHQTVELLGDSSWRKSTLSKLSKVTEETLDIIFKSKPKKVMREWEKLDNNPDEG